MESSKGLDSTPKGKETRGPRRVLGLNKRVQESSGPRRGEVTWPGWPWAPEEIPLQASGPSLRLLGFPLSKRGLPSELLRLLAVESCVPFKAQMLRLQFSFALILCPVSPSEPGQAECPKASSYKYVTSSMLGLGPFGAGQELGTAALFWASW